MRSISRCILPLLALAAATAAAGGPPAEPRPPAPVKPQPEPRAHRPAPRPPEWWTELRARIALLGQKETEGLPLDPRLRPDGTIVLEGVVEREDELEAARRAVQEIAAGRRIELDAAVVPELRKVEWTDAELERVLQARIDADPDFSELGVAVSEVLGGRVTIAGAVPEARLRDEAERRVADDARVREVKNHIDVIAPGEFARRGRRALEGALDMAGGPESAP